MYSQRTKSHWGIWRNGITLNEGGGPVNFTLLFPWSYAGLFIYFYWFGRKFIYPRSKPQKDEA
jgi:hypothetical protein